MEIIQRKLNKFILNYENVFPYFLKHISCGNTLSNFLVRNIDFKKGVFYTLLPDNPPMEKVYHFSHGGIFPTKPCGTQEFANALGVKFIPKQIITLDNELCEFIWQFLKLHKDNVAILDNVLAESTENNLEIQNVRLTFFHKEVYYALNQKTSLDSIWETIRTPGQVWHFQAVLVEKMLDIPSLLLESHFEEMCCRAKFIIAGSYDGEGYIFWEKTM